MAKRRKAVWDAEQIQALRKHLEMTQGDLADELNVRQQTVSEWETGQYQPRQRHISNSCSAAWRDRGIMRPCVSWSEH